jgi:hypothetical protein
METQCKQRVMRGPPSMALRYRVVADNQGAVFSLITTPQPQQAP